MYERNEVSNRAQALLTGGLSGQGYNENAVKLAPPRDKSTMDMAIDTLSSHISAAEIIFQGLSDKLKPILSTVDGGSTSDPIRPASCELEDRILTLASRMTNLNNGINCINSRVCL